MGKLLEPSQNIERSIMKKYRKELWNPFIKAIAELRKTPAYRNAEHTLWRCSI